MRFDFDNMFKVAFGVWVFGVLVNIAMVVGIIWAAIHFISKYW